MPALNDTPNLRFIAESYQTKKGYIVVDSFAAPAAASNTAVHAAVTLPASGTTTVTTAITNPVTPRTIRLKGNQVTTQALVVTIKGTDSRGNALSEDVTMGGAFATPTDSVNAFATVTSIIMPARGGASDTISVGVGVGLGLSRKLAGAADTGILGSADLVQEATRPTFTANATYAKNLVSFNTAPDGAKNFKAIYVSDELYGAQG